MMEEEIPFKHVSIETKYNLANKLDPPSNVRGNDWRMLAEKLGFTFDEIMCVEVNKPSHGRNTLSIFEEYIRKNGTVQKIRKALEEMERRDALEILLEAIPDIKKRYEHELSKKRNKATEHEDGSAPSDSCRTAPDRYLMDHNCCRFPNRSLNFRDNSTSYGWLKNSNTHKNNPTAQMQYPYYATSQSLNISSRPISSTNSMLVNVDEDGCLDCNNSNIEMLEERSVREIPASLPRAIYLGEMIHNVPALVDPADMAVGAEEEVTTSEETLAMFVEKSPDLIHKGCAPFGDFIRKNKLGSPSNPLDNLKMLATLPDKYKPDEHYQNFVLDPQAGASMRGTENYGSVKAEVKDYSCMLRRDEEQTGEPNLNSFCTPTKKCMHKCANNSTYNNQNSMGLKHSVSVTECIQQDDFSRHLKKSNFMPNKKPAESRKAFRHIKVFVTYANGNKKHIQKVLSLCNCLERNGFTCCMDIYHDKLTVDEKNKLGWYDKKFKEADFIVVCVSPQYKKEVDSDNNLEEGVYAHHDLHTKYIYNLMKVEHLCRNSPCTRFIPLLFEGCTRDLIPLWLANSYVFIWPQQYKDLLWMLTKPEERIKPQTHSLSNHLPDRR